MEEIQIYAIIIGQFIALLIAAGGYDLAKRRNRNPGLWFINCYLMGVIGLIILGCSSPLEDEEEWGERKTDILGYATLILALAWGALMFYIGYQYTQSYHNQIIWNGLMHLMR